MKKLLLVLGFMSIGFALLGQEVAEQALLLNKVQCSVGKIKVENQAGELLSAGTGFVVYADENTVLVATAWHVVAGIEACRNGEACNYKAAFTMMGWNHWVPLTLPATCIAQTNAWEHPSESNEDGVDFALLTVERGALSNTVSPLPLLDYSRYTGSGSTLGGKTAFLFGIPSSATTGLGLLHSITPYTVKVASSEPGSILFPEEYRLANGHAGGPILIKEGEGYYVVGWLAADAHRQPRVGLLREAIAALEAGAGCLLHKDRLENPGWFELSTLGRHFEGCQGHATVSNATDQSCQELEQEVLGIREELLALRNKYALLNAEERKQNAAKFLEWEREKLKTWAELVNSSTCKEVKDGFVGYLNNYYGNTEAYDQLLAYFLEE